MPMLSEVKPLVSESAPGRRAASSTENPEDEAASRQALLIKEFVESQVREAMSQATAKLEVHIGVQLVKSMRTFEGMLEAVVEDNAEHCQHMSAQINRLQTEMEEVHLLMEKQAEEMDARDNIDNMPSLPAPGENSIATTMGQLQSEVQELGSIVQADRESRDRAHSLLASDVAGACLAIGVFREELANLCTSPGRPRGGEIDSGDIDRLTKLINEERAARVEFTNVIDEERAALLVAAQAEAEQNAREHAELKTDLLTLIDCERKAREEFQRSFQGKASTQGSTHVDLWKVRKSIADLSKKHTRKLDEISLRMEVVVASMVRSAEAPTKRAESDALSNTVDLDEHLPEAAQLPMPRTRSVTFGQMKERHAAFTELVTRAMEVGGFRYKAPQSRDRSGWESSSSVAAPKGPKEDGHAIRVDVVHAALGGDPRTPDN